MCVYACVYVRVSIPVLYFHVRVSIPVLTCVCYCIFRIVFLCACVNTGIDTIIAFARVHACMHAHSPREYSSAPENTGNREIEKKRQKEGEALSREAYSGAVCQ